MLASLPVSMLNQSLDDLGIPIESTSLHPALVQIVVVLTIAVAMKALSSHYDFSWIAALAGN
jgi:hypothetical protein